MTQPVASASGPIAYPPIERHGVIGDRHTAALIAADGTVDWLCLPSYRGDIVCGALLDHARGGYFRFGPVARCWGEQRYDGDTAVLVTQYALGSAQLVAHDFMLWTGAAQGSSGRVLVRRIQACGGDVECVLDFAPRQWKRELRLFCTHTHQDEGGVQPFRLRAGEQAWAVLSYADDSRWTAERAQEALVQTRQRWQAWSDQLQYDSPLRSELVRSLLTIHLLGYAPTGALVAAPTTSLPERIGGDWNADYRLCWVRDSSLSLQALARHRDLESARLYFDFLAQLDGSREHRLHVLYGLRGEEHVPQETLDFDGYRGSRPVRAGNHAYGQKQLGSGAYLSDCALTYLREEAPWRPEYFELVAREADYALQHWDEADNGIWELSAIEHRVASRVGSWVTLARASEIAELIGQPERARSWREIMPQIHHQVLERGYSERLGSFVQAYGAENLDASSLLIPILGFLPPSDPRVLSTLERIERDLTIDGHVYRFDPQRTAGCRDLPLGEHEGSFVLCTCWLASAYALAGRTEKAIATLARVRAAAGPLGLLPEGLDARSGTFLGNYPLLFAHAEFVRALVNISRALRNAERPES